ncbi:MAG: methyltransferase [Romboutsia sp.]|uniref:methyltransferase n=1 Tax=Romboutsia sp. TaxID=1965302 RepID=UPI003F346887
MQDIKCELLLNINTFGEELWSEKINHYHPYQATSYEALDTLFSRYKVTEDDYIVDFGCGKGRLNFYINYMFNSTVVGIEMNENYYHDCLINKENYLKVHKKDSSKIDFKCCFAQNYKINKHENKFYFFNPFSVQIFRKIVNNIISSFYEFERKIEFIIYYPSDDYIYYLENETPLILKDEIRLNDLYKQDSQERFLVYELCY